MLKLIKNSHYFILYTLMWISSAFYVCKTLTLAHHFVSYEFHRAQTIKISLQLCRKSQNTTKVLTHIKLYKYKALTEQSWAFGPGIHPSLRQFAIHFFLLSWSDGNLNILKFFSELFEQFRAAQQPIFIKASTRTQQQFQNLKHNRREMLSTRVSITINSITNGKETRWQMITSL